MNYQMHNQEDEGCKGDVRISLDIKNIVPTPGHRRDSSSKCKQS